eukprot:5876090-Pyramimonas_sp.AAC.1
MSPQPPEVEDTCSSSSRIDALFCPCRLALPIKSSPMMFLELILILLHALPSPRNVLSVLLLMYPVLLPPPRRSPASSPSLIC